jgi:DNA sulfur modification protein DndB
MRLIPKIFLFDEDELVPELRAQRVLNRARVPDMARYLTENPDSYVFSAITASIDAEIRFEPLAGAGDDNIGLLKIPMSGRFIINDGQHRRAAIELALRERPGLADETISVVFFVDVGLARSQQMFADLNRYAIRPSTSISILYDHRDEMAELARRVVNSSQFFRDLVETERSTLSLRSRRLFTFSAIYGATNALLAGISYGDIDEGIALATSFWAAVGKQLPEWEQVRQGQIPASEVREDLIHSHGVVLHAIGRVGNTLLREHPADWEARLGKLRELNWSRNDPLWAGRAVVGGRLSKQTNQVILTANVIKKRMGLDLTPDERRLEDTLARMEHEPWSAAFA